MQATTALAIRAFFVAGVEAGDGSAEEKVLDWEENEVEADTPGGGVEFSGLDEGG